MMNGHAPLTQLLESAEEVIIPTTVLGECMPVTRGGRGGRPTDGNSMNF
jgi:hypothetical protein